MALGPIMLDIDGTALTPADRDLLKEPAVGGVVLFTRNFQSVEQVTELVRDIRACRQPSLLVAVDHEGGRVQRFREGFSPVPPMRSLGRAYATDAKAANAMSRFCGWLIGAELRACGIDLCFAPCIDLDWGVSNVIGDRAFDRSPEVVVDLATHFCRGLKSAGMRSVGKHFPGHGAVVADSHEELPVDRRDYSALLDDIRPYERMIASRDLSAIMTAHVVYEQIDRLPATFSKAWIQSELRDRLRFDGAIFSDDLTMKATNAYGSMPERAKKALEVGCDMLLICNNRPAAERAVIALAGHQNPVSYVRLARLHGDRAEDWDALHASAEWADASAALAAFLDRPTFELGA